MSTSEVSERSPVLVVGSDSTIGRGLLGALKDFEFKVYSTTRRKDSIDSNRKFFLDLANPIVNVFPKPFLNDCSGGTAFILAAETSIDVCARDPEISHAINVQGTERLARFLIDHGMRVVFLSTNLVFDGSIPHRNAGDLPCPQTAYGMQKAEAEKRLLALSNKTLIVRLTKVFHKEHTLLKTWRDSLKANELIHPFSDMLVAPVSLDYVVNILRLLVDSDVTGVVQLSGPEEVTYADIAVQLAKVLGASQGLVQPVKSDRTQLVSFPAYTTLDTKCLKRALGVGAPDQWSFLGIFSADRTETLTVP